MQVFPIGNILPFAWRRRMTRRRAAPEEKEQQTPLEDVAAFVRERRRANSLTQAELGELAQVGRRLVVELEQGKPTLRCDAVNRVLAVFGRKLGAVELDRR